MAFRITGPGMKTAVTSHSPGWLTARRGEPAKRATATKMLLL